MTQPDLLGNVDPGFGVGGTVGGPDAGAPTATGTEEVVAAARARSAAWSASVAIDLGDSHDKGEDSLCVGEAA